MKNIRMLSIIMVFLLLVSVSCSFADEIVPRADLVFQNVNATLYSGKYVLFTALAYQEAESISVTSVRLEQKVNGAWVYVTNLACPPAQSSCIRYNQMKYYTSEISSGTYRVVVTFCADSYYATRTSAECTF